MLSNIMHKGQCLQILPPRCIAAKRARRGDLFAQNILFPEPAIPQDSVGVLEDDTKDTIPHTGILNVSADGPQKRRLTADATLEEVSRANQIIICGKVTCVCQLAR